MPRGHRRGNRHSKPKDVEIDDQLDARGERTVLFSKTKMCKFFILGSCTKGPECKFAHHRDELNPLPDLSRTKICKTLIATGSCEDPNCRYAHNREELRAMPMGSLPSPRTTGPEHGALPPMPDAFAAMAAAALSFAQQGHHGQQPAWPELSAMPQEQAAALHQWFNTMAAQALQWAMQATPASNAAPGQPQGDTSSALSSSAALGSGGVCWSQDVQADVHTASETSPEKPAPRLVIKNTFLDLDSGSTPQVCPRSNTWAGGLCALAEDSEDLAEDAEFPLDSSPQLVQPMTDNAWRLPVPGLAPGLGDWGQLCVPEQQCTFGRQASTSSETSTYASSEKRVQDTPLGGQTAASVRSSSSRSNLTTLCEDDSEVHADVREASHQPAVSPVRSDRSSFPLDYHPGPDLSGLFGAFDLGGVIVKNTFLEFDTPSTPVAGLRAVHTASGRLDAMGMTF